VSGALAERDFVEKLEKVGFGTIEVVSREPWGINDCAMYPLFDDELIALMKRVIPSHQQARIGDSIVVKARLAEAPEDRSFRSRRR
jgi:arsenite methyltransferase